MDIERKSPDPDKEHGSEGESGELPQGVKLVMPDDKFSFHCSRCGECCRNVENAIMLESLDVFRISRYIKQIGNTAQSIDEILEVCASGAPLFNIRKVFMTSKTLRSPLKQLISLLRIPNRPTLQ